MISLHTIYQLGGWGWLVMIVAWGDLNKTWKKYVKVVDSFGLMCFGSFEITNEEWQNILQINPY